MATTVTARDIGREAVLRGVRLGRRTVARRPGRGAAPPPAVPDGWHTAPPDFVGVGAAGAASGWWHAQIERHPAVRRLPGTPRELHWFERFWSVPFGRDDAEAYARWFPRPAGDVAGEWTPSYFADFWMPEMLAAAAPKARILVLLRDPIARYAAARARSASAGAPPWDDRDAMGAYQRGLYAEPLRRFLDAYPRDQVLILQDEACRADPDAQLARTLAFIGLPEAELAAATAQLPEPVMASLPDSVTSALIEAYTPDQAELLELATGLDLGLWTGAHRG